MAKLKVVKGSLISKDELSVLGQEYSDISNQIKVLEARKKELAEVIKNGAEKIGAKDDKGSFYVETDSVILGKVAKKSIKIDQTKAKEVLESMGMGDIIDAVTTYTVNEKKLEQAVLDQRITAKEVESFTNTSVSYSVSVKVVEEVPEVEQSTLMVAKKK